MKKLIGVVGMLAMLIGLSGAQVDMAYLAESPACTTPLDYLYLEPCDEVTLYVVLYCASATASSINIPIMYDPLVEVLDYGFNTDAWGALPPGFCGSVWNFFPSHDEVNMYVNWYAYTGVYPVCDIPVGWYMDVGWITFHCIGSGMTEIIEGVGPTGMGLLYTNGATATDYYCEWTVLVIEQGSGVKEGGLRDIPKVPFLANATPSLFNGSTSINYGITKDEHVSLKVYNAAGQVVRTLANDNMKAGSYTASWDGRDDMGRHLASGVYFTKLNTESINASRKVVLR